MSGTRGERFAELLAQALERPAEEQKAFIESRCPDPDLRRELIDLLDMEARLDGFLEQPAGLALGSEEPKAAPSDSAAPSKAPELPKSIGPFRIREVLGEGGMGVVYLAEQDEPIQRELAVKVVRADLEAPGARERFAAERQALARLSHPAIARIYEAGTTEEGFPWFAMELATGETITDYCDGARLSLEERLRLFLQVCDGVQHAHHRGIIHRDLKPANVLVTEREGRPAPKVIDFGIAKALDQPLSGVTELTGNHLIGTPAYMSPEGMGLVDGTTDVDTRTDVYALGVLLYELLSGARPFETAGASLARVLVRISSEDAERPSTKLRSEPRDDQERAADRRRTSRESLLRTLRADLDWIVTRAIARDRADRYNSPADLAADVERHLASQPVLARPSSFSYVLGKLVRRHRGAVMAAGLVLLTLVLGIVGTSVGFLRARSEAERATQEAETATAVSDFVLELFRVSDPSEARGSSITARELLDKGAARIDDELSGEPLVQSRMMHTMGTVYASLGLYNEATRLLEQSLELRRSQLGTDHVEVAEAMNDLAIVMKDRGDYTAAEPLYREALAIRRQALGNDHHDVSESLNDLALLLSRTGKQDAAESLLRESLEISRRLYGNDDPVVATTMNNLAMILDRKGDSEAAAPLHRQTLELRRRLLGEDHPAVATSLNNLALSLWSQRDYDEAESLFRECLELTRRVRSDEHPLVGTTLNNLALVLRDRGDHEAAEPVFREALALRRRVLGDVHPDVAVSLYTLASMFARQGNHAAAEPLFREAVAIQGQTLPAGHRRRHLAELALGTSLTGLGRYAEAEPILLVVHQALEDETGPESKDARRAREALLELYESWDRPAKAEEFRTAEATAAEPGHSPPVAPDSR